LNKKIADFIFRKKRKKKLHKIRDNSWRFQEIFVSLQSDSCSGRDLTNPTFFKPKIYKFKIIINNGKKSF